MKKRIHVNQHAIRANRQHGSNLPVITCKTYRSHTYAHEVEIHGPCRLVYSPDRPLSCGATVWIETDAATTLIRHDDDEVSHGSVSSPD